MNNMTLDEEIMNIKRRLKDHENRLQELEKVFRISKGEKQEICLSKTNKGIEKLAEKIGITKEKIREIFDIEENISTVVKTVGENYKEKIKNISLLALLGYEYFFGRNKLFSQEIRRNVAENGIPLDNFASYLNEIIPSLIRRKGKTKSSKTTYRLTILGKSEARKLLKNLCEG